MELNMGLSAVDFLKSTAEMLQDIYPKEKQGEILLPLVFLSAMEQQKKQLDTATPEETISLAQFSTSSNGEKEEFLAYLDDLSPDIQEVIKAFSWKEKVTTLWEQEILFPLIYKVEALCSKYREYHHPLFQTLVTSYYKHTTSPLLLELMADCLFISLKDTSTVTNYTCYDGACGLGDTLFFADTYFSSHYEQGKKIALTLKGQEGEYYALASALNLLQGKSISLSPHSALSQDACSEETFDFIFSLPPCGKNWKEEKEFIGSGNNPRDPRFFTYFQDKKTGMIPRVTDSQLLYFLHHVSKLNKGSRMVQVHNGALLFSGDAGSGESNARRYVLERDLVECIILLPTPSGENHSYLWILSGEKEEKRRGKVQLIDGRRGGNTSLNREGKESLFSLYENMTENDCSKVFPVETFGYWKVTVVEPTRSYYHITPKALEETREMLGRYGVDKPNSSTPQIHPADFLDFMIKNPTVRTIEMPKTPEEIKALELLSVFFKILKDLQREEPYYQREEFQDAFHNHKIAKELGLNVRDYTKFLFYCVVYSPLGEIETGDRGGFVIDQSKTQRRQIPFLYPEGIDGFFQQEILPTAPDAQIQQFSTKVGYEISFPKYFSETKELPSLEEIVEELRVSQEESEALMSELLGGVPL